MKSDWQVLGGEITPLRAFAKVMTAVLVLAGRNLSFGEHAVSVLATLCFQEEKQVIEVYIYFQNKQNKYIQEYISCLCSESILMENVIES